MHLFRRSLPLDQALVRPATANDLGPVQYLFRYGGRRFFGFFPDDLPALLARMPATLLEGSGDAWGVMISGWRARTATWLRGFALAEGVAVSDGVALLLPQFARQLRNVGLSHIYYAGDEPVDRWLQPVLQAYGFQPDSQVVVFEKRDHSLPSKGNQEVMVRPAQIFDMAALITLDERSFDDQWTKGGEVLNLALREVPFFVVAERAGMLCGYAFATSHYNGRLLHLVRIAVDPALRGQGIGVRLLAELGAFAERCEAEVITLNTQSDNHRAQQLYTYFNFHLTGEQQTVLRLDL